MEVVASLSQGRTAAAQCGLFTRKSVPVIFEPPCIYNFGPIFYIPCSSCKKIFGARDTRKNLLSEHEYCGNVCSENNTLLRGINKFLSLHSTFID